MSVIVFVNIQIFEKVFYIRFNSLRHNLYPTYLDNIKNQIHFSQIGKLLGITGTTEYQSGLFY